MFDSSRVDFSLPKIIKALPDKNKVAYTLSEVILVIGIIGIIAALTIPQLVQNSQNKELVSAFLKSNNVLANAYKNAKAIDNIHKMAPTDFKETLKKYLKTVDCENHDICLQDGMFVDFTCNETTCTELTVNTNGDKKPNQAGKDKFKFNITQDGIIPQGEPEQCSGFDCGMYTLTYHKIFEGLVPDCIAYEAGKCKTCDNGYHLEDNKTCSAIDMPTCDSFEGETCVTCKKGYAGSDCDVCDTGYKGAKCNECDEFYHDAGGNCEEGNVANCLEYENGICSVCDTSAGYKLLGGICIKPMTSNGTLGGDSFAVSGTQFNSSWLMYNAINNSLEGATVSGGWGNGYVRNASSYLYNPQPIKLASLTMTDIYNQSGWGGTMTISGSNDNVSYSEEQVVNTTPVRINGHLVESYDLNFENKYKYYKISYTNQHHDSTGGYYTYVQKLEFTTEF